MFQLSKPSQYTPHLKYFNIANTKTGLYLLSLSKRAKKNETFKNGKLELKLILLARSEKP
jgi:hypothetical protein